MKFWVMFFAAFVASALGEIPPKNSENLTAETKKDTLVDTVFVKYDGGIPWNRDRFDPEILLRHESFDPAIKVAYSYSLNFVGGTFGSFGSQNFLAHLAYEFSPELHLYANVGLWMPLYSNYRFGGSIAKEDVRRGKVDIIIPDLTLEYKPSENTSFRLMIVNEKDAFKAYGPGFYSCNPFRNSIFCR